MLREVASIVVIIILGASAWAGQRCDRPDSSFGVFLSRFKNDPSFRESRLVTPLQYSLTDPEKTTKERLTLEQIRARKMEIICGAACAARLKGTEGQLCEAGPTVKGNRAEFIHTRVAQTFMVTLTILFVTMAVGFFRVSSRQGANSQGRVTVQQRRFAPTAQAAFGVMIGDAKK